QIEKINYADIEDEEYYSDENEVYIIYTPHSKPYRGQEDEDLFYNLWTEIITEKNLAAYIAFTAEVEAQPSTMQ
ncbi:22822_t:CDS:2, partial [Cetraspora pellucida]